MGPELVTWLPGSGLLLTLVSQQLQSPSSQIPQGIHANTPTQSFAKYTISMYSFNFI